MKLQLWVFGKDDAYVKEGFEMFVKRISRYISFEVRYFEYQKGKTSVAVKDAESSLILKKLDEKDILVLLDERGKEFSSEKFSRLIQSFMSEGNKKIIFLIGGAYGFNDQLRNRAQQIISMSQFTFPHQLARLIFAEQLYRAFTIMNNEPYHHS